MSKGLNFQNINHLNSKDSCKEALERGIAASGLACQGA